MSRGRKRRKGPVQPEVLGLRLKKKEPEAIVDTDSERELTEEALAHIKKETEDNNDWEVTLQVLNLDKLEEMEND